MILVEIFISLLLVAYFSICKDALQMGASQFEQSAGSLKRKMAWQNMKVSFIRLSQIELRNNNFCFS